MKPVANESCLFQKKRLNKFQSNYCSNCYLFQKHFVTKRSIELLLLYFLSTGKYNVLEINILERYKFTPLCFIVVREKCDAF